MDDPATEDRTILRAAANLHTEAHEEIGETLAEFRRELARLEGIIETLKVEKADLEPES